MGSHRGKRVYVAGHRGMVGSAIVRRLERENCEIITAARSELDLTDQAAVSAWMADRRPDHVYIAAAKVGGILANATYPADFLYQNLMIEANLIHSAYRTNVEKLLFLGSSCIYPKFAPQPIEEGHLLTGALEPTNEWYAVAKISGIKLVQAYRKQYGCDFISAMPTNLYGPGDNYDFHTSHVLPAMIRRAHRVKTGETNIFEIWGTGEPRREFLHADDCADACVFLMQKYSNAEPVNVGCGSDIRIIDLAKLVCKIVGVTPKFAHDLDKPDGTPRKLMSNTKLQSLGWNPMIGLEEGIQQVYAELMRYEAPAFHLGAASPQWNSVRTSL